MKKYKSYLQQGKECDKTGNRFIVVSPWDGHKILICQKYKCVCNSGACREERMK